MPMGHRTHERPMSVSEREFLESILKSVPSNATRLKEGAKNSLLLWTVFIIPLALAWLLVAWLVRLICHVEIGWSSPVAIWIVVACTSTCAWFAVAYSIRWVRGWGDIRPALREDLDHGRVVEELYQLTEARCFEDPEDGELVYFLRTSDDKVLVLYDYDSEDLACERADPSCGSSEPHTELLVVRAPETDIVIRKVFSGTLLNVGDPLEATDPMAWPDSEGYWDVPWNELDTRLRPSGEQGSKRPCGAKTERAGIQSLSSGLHH